MSAPDPITDQAIALAGSLAPGEDNLRVAVQHLAGAADRAALEQARHALVRRIHERSDDYQATAALNLVNKALATVGWYDPYSWKHRRKP